MVINLADRPALQGGRSAGGAEMSADAGADRSRASRAGRAQRSEGVWHAAWRRFRGDRVGMVSLVVVAAFLLLIVLSATGLVAGDWQREVGVPNAPPTFLGPAAAGGGRRDRSAEGAQRRPVRRRPAGAALQGMGRARRAVRRPPRRQAAETLPFGGDRLGRDVLAKAIKGTEISVFVGVLAALVATADRHPARRAGRLLRRRGRRLARVALQRLHRRSPASC